MGSVPGKAASSSQLKAVPLLREPVSERVVGQILGWVRVGNLKPGDRLPPERELAETFEVSRPTIREAVRALATLGVLKIRHGGGTVVSPLEAADLLEPLTFFLTLREIEVDQLYEARRLIEGEVASRAAVRATPADIAAMREMIAQQEAAIDDPIAYRRADSSFHARLAVMSDNVFLARAGGSLNVLGLEFRRAASETKSVITVSIRDHKAILRAVEAGDAGAAREAMQAHMMHVLRSTKAQFGDWTKRSKRERLESDS
jgi:GntR family transcriptional repressor for pyruvate dehydrogenase complex